MSQNPTPRAPNIDLAEARIAKCLRGRKKILDLSNLALDSLPERVRSLRWLQSLNVRQNNIEQLPDWIGELTELRELNLGSNPLQGIPASINQLIRLECLLVVGGAHDLASEVIGELTSLKWLVLSNLGLTAVPEWIRGLENLEKLYLDGNEFTALPEWLGELELLIILTLGGNQLVSLPESARQLRLLRVLDVNGNHRLGIPPEIMSGCDAPRILDYYFRAASSRSSRPLNEFKLILVGRGGVGKTTLVTRLVTDHYKEFKRTPGINITKWPTAIDGDDVRAHIWDFGGQEIMHGTHRFFMTERALYLVLLSGREGSEDHDAEYWLSLVRSFAGDVPIIILLHKWSDYRFELNRELLREKYGRNIVFLETDSQTGKGIPELREQICQLAKGLPGLKAAWPGEWRRIKDVLPAKRKSWLTFDDFRSFCSREGVVEPRDQDALAGSLHDLGLMLSYRNEQELRDIGVLNPQWVTKGIYEMLNAPLLREAGGTFTVKTFADVLPDKAYPAELHRYLLALMRKFQLCHPLDMKGEKHLIPELLTKEEPKLDADFPPEQCLGFVYSYSSVLPEGLLPRFIVETYVLREPKRAWRTGVVLERANCRALVRGDVQARSITIRVVGHGSGRRELLGIIREHFERIHKTYEKLPVTELVPIPGHPDARVGHETLLKYERAGRATILVEIGDELKELTVSELLEGVDLPGAPRGMSADQDAVWKKEWLRRRDALSVFISYSHKDAPFLDQLKSALVPYERKGEMTIWSDSLIEPGQARAAEVVVHLERAQVVILLLSNDFMKSVSCMDGELSRAVERHSKGECVIVPILVRACRSDKLDIGDLQAIRPRGKPIGSHRDKDAAWFEVTKELDRAIAGLKGRGASGAELPIDGES